MSSRRRSFGYGVAALELASGIVVAALMIGIVVDQQGLPGLTLLDRAFPVLVAVAALVLVGFRARRSFREARSREPVRPPPPPRPRPDLSPAGRDTVDRIVAALSDAGVFTPRAPAPRVLDEGVADQGEPVTVDAVLGALSEQDARDLTFQLADHTGNLAFHPSHSEQGVDVLQDQVRDLDRLAGDVSVTLDEAELEPTGRGSVRTRLRVSIGSTTQTLDYAGDVKYLSTHLHVAVARALEPSSARLAWLWTDQGAWITSLCGPDTLARLNAALGDTAPDPWEWVDEQEPVAAGEFSRPDDG